jgi:hypothetical protein
MAGKVCLHRHISRDGFAKNWLRAIFALAVMFAFFGSRNLTPEFHRLPFVHHASISSISIHSQRPQFDSDGLRWSAPANVFLPFPPGTESASSPITPQLYFALRIKGFHYNRPPPAA